MNAVARIDRPDGPMSRGGRRKDQDGPERRCVVTGDSGPTGRLIRFVLSPAGEAVPDLAGKLPGRGAWLTADRGLVLEAIRKRSFSRAFRTQVTVADDLDQRLEALLTQRLIETLGLARKASQAVAGQDKVRARITGGTAAILFQATDGAADGISKLAALARAAGNGQISRLQVLNSAELGLAFGREFAIHAALDAGGFAVRATTEATRLSGFREDAVLETKTEQRPGSEDSLPGPSAESTDTREAPDAGARK